MKTVKLWRKAAVSKYGSPAQQGKPGHGKENAQMRRRTETIHGGTMTVAGWSDAAYGGQSTLGKCRLRYVIGLMSSTLRGPCHIIQWASKFARKLVEGSLGGDVYALREMLDHTSMLREFYALFSDMSPGMMGFGDCEILLTHLKTKKIFAARHFLAIQQAIEFGEFDSVHWLPGQGNPVDGLAETKTDLIPLLRLLEAGSQNPGVSRALRNVAASEQ